MSYRAKFETENSPVDNLIAGNAHLLVGRTVTILQGQVLPRGAVLGKVTASGKYVLSLAAEDDGSEDVDLILAEDVDATAADRQVLAYARGDFASIGLTLGAGHTLASITEPLRAKGITLLPAVPA